LDTLFFIASKLVWALLRPDTLFLLLVASALLGLLLGRPRLASWTLLAAATSGLIVAVLPVGDLVLRPLERRYPVAPDLSDVTGILVLSGSEDVAPSLTWGAPQFHDAGDRLLAAAALAHRFPDATVLLIGGRGTLAVSATSESALSRDALVAMGISEERLITEGRSRNTSENATLSLELASELEAGTWVLVTSAHHMPRAMATFCRAGWSGLVAWPTDFRSADPLQRMSWDFVGHLDDLSVGTREWLGWLAYRLSGRLNEEAC
jgi:uncharacterized SAM-binding protein YcdF (DUF218 family)